MLPIPQLSLFEVKVDGEFVPVMFSQLEPGDIFRTKNDPAAIEWDTYKGDTECVVMSSASIEMEALSVVRQKAIDDMMGPTKEAVDGAPATS